jgi:Uma2 family endonuclease
MIAKAEATIEELYHVPEHGKAELVNGEIVRMSPAGGRSGRAVGRVVASLLHYEDERGDGHAIGDNVGFIVNLPNRKSFSPNAAWYVGNVDTMEFLQGAPRLAVEVRCEGDYGRRAERTIANKIADYFAAGTLVVWDADLLGEDVIKCYRASNPAQPTIFRRGEVADAEPAVPGWRLPVDDLFK